MKPPTIDYVWSPECLPASKWPKRVGLALAGSALAWLLLCGVTISVTTIRMDAVTGSTERRTRGPLGLGLWKQVDASPLEMRLKQAGVPWSADWRFLSEVETRVLGKSRACASMPEVGEIRSMLKEFADASTDAELRQFVRVMETGTAAGRRAAVEAAGEKALAVTRIAR